MAKRPHEKEKAPASLIAEVLWFPVKMSVKLLCASVIAIIVSIGIEWVGLIFLWPDQPHHAYEMFQYEFNALGDTFKNAVAGISPIKFIRHVVMVTYAFLFDSWLFHTLNNLWQTPTESSFGQNMQATINGGFIFIEAAGYIILTIVMRIVIFLLSAPWFLLCALTGFVNGAVEREIRKFEGGIEHGLIYHLAKSHLNLFIFLPWIIYLSMPFAIHPAWILIPGGALFGFTVFVTVWSFKKYL